MQNRVRVVSRRFVASSCFARNSSTATEQQNALRSAIAERASAQRFASDPVPDNVLADVLRLTQRAPSGFNMQPYACILVRSAEDRERLAASMLAKNADRVKEAPLVAVFAADLEPSRRVPHIQKMMHAHGFPADAISNLPHYVRLFSGEGQVASAIRHGISTLMSPLRAVPSPVPTIAWSYKQTAIAATTFMFAAQAHGLVTRPMEGFDEIRLKQTLDIPDRYSIPMAICCGYPAQEEETTTKKPSPRLEPSDLFFDGRFGQSSAQWFNRV